MIETMVIYLMIVADYQECRGLKCHVIFNNCPQVTHYDYLKTKRDIEREANLCFMSERNQGFIKSYKRRLK